MRFCLVCLAALLALPVAAQAPDGLASGDRVRILFGPDGLRNHGVVYTGVVEVAGDTLTLHADSGARFRFRPRDLAAFDVSAGRGPYPYWLVGASAAVGLASGYLVGDASVPEKRCSPYYVPGPPRCRTVRREAELVIHTAFAGAAATLVSAFVAARMRGERWVPIGSVTAGPGGVAWRLTL